MDGGKNDGAIEEKMSLVSMPLRFMQAREYRHL